MNTATPEGRWRAYDYENLVNRDKARQPGYLLAQGRIAVRFR